MIGIGVAPARRRHHRRHDLADRAHQVLGEFVEVLSGGNLIVMLILVAS